MQLLPEKSPKGIGFAIMRVLLLSYVLFGALLYFRQDHSLFFPPGTPMEDCTDLSQASIIVAEGTRAYYLASGTSTKIAVVYHGNAERACDSAYFATWVAHYGYNVLLVEYSGYAGDTTHTPSVKLLLEDVAHIAAWVSAQHFSDVLLVGRSIGTGFASAHASIVPPEKLLLIAPFDTLAMAAREHYRIYPISLFLKTDLDNVKNAAVAKEVLIIHGTEDVIVPIARGKALFAQLPQEKKTFLEITGYAHNDVLGTLESWAAIKDFME